MGRESFLRKIGYVGCSWPLEYSHLRRNLKIDANPAGFHPETGTPMGLETLEEIPATLSLSVDDHEKVKEQYVQWRMTRKEMMYFIKHDVIVVESSKNKNAPETRTMVRCVSLIDVAGAWLAAATGNKTSSLYALTSKESFKHIYAVAYFFKGFLDKFIDESDFTTHKLLPTKDIIQHGITWTGLTGSSFTRNINWGNVRFSKEKYKDGNVPVRAAASAGRS